MKRLSARYGRSCSVPDVTLSNLGPHDDRRGERKEDRQRPCALGLVAPADAEANADEPPKASHAMLNTAARTNVSLGARPSRRVTERRARRTRCPRGRYVNDHRSAHAGPAGAGEPTQV